MDLNTWSPVGGRFRFDFDGGSMSLGQTLRVQSLIPLPVHSFCFLLARDSLSFLLRLPCLLVAMSPCHDGLLCPWNRKTNLSYY